MVNSTNSVYVPNTQEEDDTPLAGDGIPTNVDMQTKPQYENFEEADFEEVVDKNTGEVEEPQTETKVEEDEF